MFFFVTLGKFEANPLQSTHCCRRENR